MTTAIVAVVVLVALSVVAFGLGLCALGASAARGEVAALMAWWRGEEETE